MTYKIYFLFFIFLGCAQVTSLNLQKHQFGQIPTKIVWIQVAGFEEEHLATLKFDSSTKDEALSFEKFLCLGKAWEYNLYNIRPTAESSFLGQLTGDRNIKNSCEDYKAKPIWKLISKNGYKVGAFENGASNDESLESAKACGQDGSNFLDDLVIWKMNKAPAKSSQFFHVNEKSNFEKKTTYYDRSCLTGECYSNLSQNIKSVFSQFSRKSDKYLFIVRDFKYKSDLASKNYSKYKASLKELEKTVEYFLSLSSESKNMLVLLTSAKSKVLEFPKSGNQWKEFEQSGKYLIDRKSKLISTVMASGARAENFCGIYNQSQILPRIFSGSKQQGLELAIINPFD
jgi:hypothetical protein